MAIIISKNGESAKKIDKSDIDKEGYLQNYIHQNPEAIPVYEIQEDKRLFVVAREFQTGSGPIDALAIDKDGDIYIVETKLYKNPDKRTVVAQALDYGAALWKHSNDFSEFINKINTQIQNNFQVSFQEKTKGFFDFDDGQVNDLLEVMRRNLYDGNLKFVVLMDSLGERLKDLIIYVNQNSQFDIFAVELEYYKYEDYEIIIPKLFGVEVKKNIKTASDSLRRQWGKEEFLQDAKSKIKDDKTYGLLSELYSFTEKNADVLDFGSGQESGSVTFKIKDKRAKSGLISIFTLWTGGTIRFRFANIKNRIGEKYVKLYYQKLKDIVPPNMWQQDALNSYGPRLLLNDVFKNEKTVELFKAAILDYVGEIKNEEISP